MRFVSLRGTCTNTAIQSDGEARRVFGESVLRIILTAGGGIDPPALYCPTLLAVVAAETRRSRRRLASQSPSSRRYWSCAAEFELVAC